MGCVQSVPQTGSEYLQPLTPVGAAHPAALAAVPPAKPVLNAVPTGRLPAGGAGTSGGKASSSSTQSYPFLNNISKTSFKLCLKPDKVLQCKIHTNPEQLLEVLPGLLAQNTVLCAPYITDILLGKGFERAGSYSQFFLATTEKGRVFACLHSKFDYEDVVPPFFPGQNQPLSEDQKNVVKRFLANPIAIQKLSPIFIENKSSGSNQKKFPFFSVYDLAVCNISHVLVVLFLIRLHHAELFGFKGFLNGFLGNHPNVFDGFNQAKLFIEGEENWGSIIQAVFGLAAQTLEANSSVQENGIVINDLKPDNLLLYMKSGSGSRSPKAEVRMGDLWGGRIINSGNSSLVRIKNPVVNFSTPDYLPKKAHKETCTKPCFELGAHAVGLIILNLLLGPEAHKFYHKKINEWSELFQNHPLKELFFIAKNLLFKDTLEDSKNPKRSRPLSGAFEELKKAYAQQEQNPTNAGPSFSSKLAAVGVPGKKLTIPSAEDLAKLLTPLAPLFASTMVDAARRALEQGVGDKGNEQMPNHLQLVKNLLEKECEAWKLAQDNEKQANATAPNASASNLAWPFSPPTGTPLFTRGSTASPRRPRTPATPFRAQALNLSNQVQQTPPISIEAPASPPNGVKSTKPALRAPTNPSSKLQ